MNKFNIEFSDIHFRLVATINGEEDYLDAVLYCSVSSTVGADGRVYGIYLRASDPVLGAAEKDVEDNPDPNYLSMTTNSVTVYDITDWPALKPAPGIVMLTPTEFEGEEGDEDEGEESEEGEVIDVQPV
jgi:hypothetical protein